AASSNQRSTFSNHNLRLGRRRVSQGWLRHQLSRSALRRPPKRWTSQRTLVGRQPPEQRMEGALRHSSLSLRMEKVPRNQPPQLRSQHAWSRKWLIRYFRKHSFCPPVFCSWSQTSAPLPAIPKEGSALARGIKDRLALLWGAGRVEFYLSFI